MSLLFFAASFCLAFLLAWGLNWLALIPWRRSRGQYWTERARLLYPARVSARMNNWLIPCNLLFLSCIIVPGIGIWGMALFGFLGATLAGFFLNREIYPHLQFRLWFHLLATGLCLFFLSFFILVFAAVEMPGDFGPLTWLAAGTIFLLLLAFHFGLGLRLLRRFGLLQPATESLKTLVAEVSEKMRVPVRATWILTTFISNAAAFPQSRQLIFTDKLLATLSDEEVKTVCAHELGHLSEPRKVLLVRAAAAFAFFPIIFSRPLTSLGIDGPTAFAGLLVGSLLLLVVSVRVSRRMEKRADAMVVENQWEGAVYARTLARIYEFNQMPAVMPKRSSQVHPDLYDRMTAAGVTPDFPKPLPPRRQCWTSYLMCAGLVILPSVAFAGKSVFALLDAAINN